MLKRRLQSAGRRVGDFFAVDMLLLRLKKRKGPILAHFLHCTPKSDLRICLNFLARKSCLHCMLLITTLLHSE
jgi:hypothetical protein